MYEFKEGDSVTFLFKRKNRNGIILNINKKTADVYVSDFAEIKTIPLSKLTVVPPFILKKEQVRQLCRYEVKWSELIGSASENAPIILEKPYTITFDDILAATKNIHLSWDDNKTVRDQWYEPIYELMFESNGEMFFEDTPDDVEMTEYLPTRADVISSIFYRDLSILCDDESAPISETITEIRDYIKNIIANEKKKIIDRDYVDEVKEFFIKKLGNDDRLKKATSLELEVYRHYIDQLIQKDNITALRCKGYGCYGGDAAYECDWNMAFKCITKLYELTGEPVYANTLGYIYYYGRCSNGEPKYDEAFKYFSIGAAGGYYESIYKLADMFVNGYGVVKNTRTAYSLVAELYNKNLQYMFYGEFDCKFADVALRMGNYAENGYSGQIDYDEAYKYYLQADFAIRQRLKYDLYGDLSVANSIRQRLNNMVQLKHVQKPKRLSDVDLKELIGHHLKQYRKLQLKIKSLKNGDIKLIIRIAPLKNEEYPPKLFITESNTAFCGMLETLELIVKDGVIAKPDNADSIIYFDNIKIYDEDGFETDRTVFVLGDDIQAEVVGEFRFKSPIKVSDKKYRIASVYFESGGRYYDYLLETEKVKVGDNVLVPTVRGEKEAVVASICDKYEYELALPLNKYKVIREPLIN